MWDMSRRRGTAPSMVPYHLCADTFQSDEVNMLHWSLKVDRRTGSSSQGSSEPDETTERSF